MLHHENPEAVESLKSLKSNERKNPAATPAPTPEEAAAQIDHLLATMNERYDGIDPGILADYYVRLEKIRDELRKKEIEKLGQATLAASLKEVADERAFQENLLKAFDSIKKALENGVNGLSIAPLEQTVKKGETVLAILTRTLSATGNEGLRARVAARYGISPDLKGNAFVKALLASDTDTTFAYKWIYAGNLVRFERDGTIRVLQGDGKKAPGRPPKSS